MKRSVPFSQSQRRSGVGVELELRNSHFHRLPGSLAISAARESLTLLSPSPAGLMTRWDLGNSCPVSHRTANMEERRAFKRSLPPSLPPACGVSGNCGFPAAFHIRISGPGRRQQWGSVRVFGLLGNQARTRRGKTLGVLQSAKLSDFLLYPLLARPLPCGWEEANEERMEPGEFCLPRKPGRGPS